VMKGKFGTLVKRIQSSPLEDIMEIVSDITEILMNYLVCISIVTAVSCGFKGEHAPLLYWVLPLAMPLYCWVLRRKAQQLSMFIVMHIPAAIVLVAVSFLYRQNQWFWILTYFLIAVVYIINSVVVRVKEKAEDSMPTMLAMIIALLMFFVGAYMESDTTCQRIIYLTLGYVFLWMMRSYAQFFYNYLYTNKSSAAVIPEKSILRISLRNALIFSILGVSIVGILVASPISAWMTDQVKEFGLLFVKAFIYLLMLVAGDGGKEPEVVENEVPVMDPSNLVGALGTSEASVFALILEKVLFLVAFVLIFMRSLI